MRISKLGILFTFLILVLVAPGYVMNAESQKCESFCGMVMVTKVNERCIDGVTYITTHYSQVCKYVDCTRITHTWKEEETINGCKGQATLPTN